MYLRQQLSVSLERDKAIEFKKEITTKIRFIFLVLLNKLINLKFKRSFLMEINNENYKTLRICRGYKGTTYALLKSDDLSISNFFKSIDD